MLICFFFKDWLTRYGYLVNDDPRTGNLRSQQDLEKAVKMLQRYAGLPETGQLDAATIKRMGESRCGVPDFGKADSAKRKKRFTLQGTYWKKRVRFQTISNPFDLVVDRAWSVRRKTRYT